MNEFDPENEASDRRIDAGLAETLGGEHAPDVTQRVLAALREESPAAKPPRRPWLVAAAVLVLGAFAVIATWQARREEQAQATTPIAPVGDAPLPQEPGWIEVSDARVIPNLPEQATAVQLRNLGDASVEALFARLPKLQFLSVFCSTVLRRNDDPADPESITDAAFATIAKFSALRMLRIEGCDAITGATLGELAALPLLESVSFRFCDTSDEGLAVLPRLPSLRSVALHGNLGFGEAGLRAIADCPGLVRLRLSACGQLRWAWFEPLERLRNLQELDLAGLSHHRGIGVGLTTARTEKLTETVQSLLVLRERELGRTDSMGGTLVDVIRNWPALRVLDLSEDLWMAPVAEDPRGKLLNPRMPGSARLHTERSSHAVARHLLTACPSLETLKVVHCSDVDDEFVQLVIQLPMLRSIDLSQCGALSAACVPMLCEARGLREVAFAEAQWLSLEHVDQLMAAFKNVRNPRSDDPAYEAELARRRAADRVSWHDYPSYARVREQGKLESLPPVTHHFELLGLGDQAALHLRQRGNVRGLAFVIEANANKARPRDDLTDIGLSLVTEIATIEALRLQGDHELTAAGFAKIANLRDLQRLEFVGLSRLTDDDVIPLVRALPKLRTLSLNGCYRVTPAVLDAIRAAPALQHLDATALAWMTPEIARELEKAKPGLSVTR